ncbi:hypothetical protein IP68_04925 [Blastomonas sp. AAP25]|uniref:hypothetical protein n=1 Tax=Blastomonas sp. AAP25 TaxID=1523416 RepID=UPI0006B9CA0E|nr:hypothetical protein [Blastomonas sp. AAP25]KPF75876.1 hypothetical protein IP68_04925 [Blastomonas sp. AAP25]
MSRGIGIIAPLPVAAVTVSDGTGGSNLLSPATREVWRAAAVGTSTIDIDFSAPVFVDTVFLGFTNATAAATWSVATMTGSGGAGLNVVRPVTTLRVPYSTGARHHAYVRLAVPVTTRYLRITLNQVGGSAPLQAGVLMAGLTIERPYEYRAGRVALDLSKRTELVDGGFGISKAAVVSSYRFTLSGLTDNQVEELWQIVMTIGESAPVLIVEGHDIAVRFSHLHYGLFQRLEPYEREEPEDTRWGLSIRDWG